MILHNCDIMWHPIVNLAQPTLISIYSHLFPTNYYHSMGFPSDLYIYTNKLIVIFGRLEHPLIIKCICTKYMYINDS